MDLKSFVGTVVGTLLALGSFYTYVDTQVESISDRITDKIYEDFSFRLQKDPDLFELYTDLSYKSFEAGLLKQLEKLSKDPDDVKDMDVLFYSRVCEKDDYFNLQYMPSSENSVGLRIACKQIMELNEERYRLR